MVLVIIPNDEDGDKRMKMPKKKAASLAKKMSKTHDVVVGTKKASAKDVLKAKPNESVKLIKRQVPG